MTIPKQVTEAADMAVQLHESMFGSDVQTEQPVSEETTPDESQPDLQEEVIEDQVEQKQQDPEETWEQRYRTLKGMFDKEVPRLNSELKEFKQLVFDKFDNKVTPEQPKQPEPKVEENARLAKFREEYGEDMYESIKEILRSEMEPVLQSKLATVEKQVTSVEETQVQAAQQNFVNYLNTKVTGDWSNLNQTYHELLSGTSPTDEKAAQFLLQSDPSGYYTNLDLVKLYSENWDADKLALVFNSYMKGDEPLVVPKQKANPAQEAIVAPSRNTAHTAPNTEGKRIWTMDMMNQFRNEDMKGKYDSATSKAMWDDLLSAPNEGRMR